MNITSVEQSVKDSPMYIGALILQELKGEEKISIFDMYALIQRKNKKFNYQNTMAALIFLHMNNLIDFDAPHIYNLKVLG